MVDAGDLADVLDVVGDLVDRRVGLGVLLAQSAENRPNATKSLASMPTSAAAAASTRHSAVAGETNSGTKVTMQTPPLAGSAASTSSGTLRGVSHRALGRQVAEDDGGVSRVEGSAHRRRRDVAEVDHHPEAVHLAHDLPAELRQPAHPGRVGGESAHGVLSLCVRVR